MSTGSGSRVHGFKKSNPSPKPNHIGFGAGRFRSNPNYGKSLNKLLGLGWAGSGSRCSPPNTHSKDETLVISILYLALIYSQCK